MPRAFLAFATLAALAVPAAAAPDTVEKTDVLDFEIVRHADGTTTMRDSSYELTFPGHAEAAASAVDAPSGGKRMTGQVSLMGADDFYYMYVIPIPLDVPYNVDVGLGAARDNALKVINAKIVKETRENLGGLEFRHTVADGEADGKKVHVNFYVAWDATHHTALGFFTGEMAGHKAAYDAFPKSFKFHKTGKNPPAIAG
ncbi:MAG TPA: hypothetical protein VGM88_18705 [Kofleriaceae bacterium]|jgi:hypothetical protein